MATRQRNDRQMLPPPSVRVLLPSRARIPTRPLACWALSLQERAGICRRTRRLTLQQLLDSTRSMALTLRLRKLLPTRMLFAGAHNSLKQ